MQLPPFSPFVENLSIISDEVIKETKMLIVKFAKLAAPYSIDLNIDFLFINFTFMNYVLIVEVFSKIKNKMLISNLINKSRYLIFAKLEIEMSKTYLADESQIFVEELDNLLKEYMIELKEMSKIWGSSDSLTTKLFTLLLIQHTFKIDEDVMRQIKYPLLEYQEEMSNIKSIAMQINDEAKKLKPKGFLSRIFGK